MAVTTKHEVMAAAAIKSFAELISQAPRCKCGARCEALRFLQEKIREKSLWADKLCAELFNDVVP